MILSVNSTGVRERIFDPTPRSRDSGGVLFHVGERPPKSKISDREKGGFERTDREEDFWPRKFFRFSAYFWGSGGWVVLKREKSTPKSTAGRIRHFFGPQLSTRRIQRTLKFRNRSGRSLRDQESLIDQSVSQSVTHVALGDYRLASSERASRARRKLVGSPSAPPVGAFGAQAGLNSGSVRGRLRRPKRVKFGPG